MMYKPKPIDTSDVVLPEDLLALTERIAENVHEVWAEGRIQDGWRYGEVRNDEKKQTPCLVPYDALPEREKDFDRNTAMETVKLIIKLGYEIQRTAPRPKADPAEDAEMAQKIADLYAAFGVKIGPLMGILSGPRVTRFEFELDPDTKLSKITKLRDDISLMLSVPRVRLICPIPGKMAFGIEVPNGREETVPFDEVFSSEDFANSTDKLCVVLGKSLSNENACQELSKAPHVLIGGQPGSGKTAVLKNMILSLICNNAPREVKLLLIDPKKQAFDAFKNADHLLEPVICDEHAAIDSLKRLCEECVRRYGLFQAQRVRNIDAYNREAARPLPRIVAFVDEMSCLSRCDPGEFELAVSRIAQAGRAAGIHIVLATSELTPKNVTGIIKANIPTRIALSTNNAMESRTIMDGSDGECLLLKGDMLLCNWMQSKPRRIQAAWLTEKEIQDRLKNSAAE